MNRNLFLKEIRKKRIQSHDMDDCNNLAYCGYYVILPDIYGKPVEGRRDA
jgi:dienelactone hydrolase